MTTIEINKDTSLPYCVLGVVDNERGAEIEKEMRKWLEVRYRLIEVWHDGSLYEQPALRFMQDLCINLHVPCLYLHTKGAYNRPELSKIVRKMWAHEFSKNRDLYFQLVDRPYAVVACPTTGSDKTTWYNGFVTNWQAMADHPLIEPNANRMKFERLFVGSATQVIGVLRNDLHREIGHVDTRTSEILAKLNL